MRSIWSGSISFGLINIPVRLYSAIDEHQINFDLLHKKDLSPIRYARICTSDGKEIPYENIVKGYEYQKGEYIVIDEEDFKKASLQKSETIDIVSFVLEKEIDPIYFEKPYYLEPVKGASKPYALLREALRHGQKVAIVKFVFKNRDHLGMIKPYKDLLVLDQLRFANEVRQTADLKLPDKNQVAKKEIEMALKLVDQLTGKFDIKEYKNTYVKNLKEVIENKMKGKATPKKEKTSKPSSKVHDIMSLLKASLEKDPKQLERKRKDKVRKSGT